MMAIFTSASCWKTLQYNKLIRIRHGNRSVSLADDTVSGRVATRSVENEHGAKDNTKLKKDYFFLLLLKRRRVQRFFQSNKKKSERSHTSTQLQKWKGLWQQDLRATNFGSEDTCIIEFNAVLWKPKHTGRYLHFKSSLHCTLHTASAVTTLLTGARLVFSTERSYDEFRGFHYNNLSE